MQKAAPSFARVALMVVFALSCFGLVLFLWLAFGGPVPLKPKGYRVSASFKEASQLATEADVRISGVPVGKVKSIEPDPKTGRSLVTFQIDSKYAPIPSDAKALLRQKTLLGETYVELTPGTAGAKKVPDNGRLADGQIGETVELDEILRTFDPETRHAFQEWTQTQAAAIDGHGRDISDALGNLGPFAEDTQTLVDILNRQAPAVRRLISNSGVVFDALSERDGQLRSLIENSNRVFQTTASRDEQLKEAFIALPTFERESRATLERLTAFAENANPLVTQLRPAARELSPTLTDLTDLAPDLELFFRDTNKLIDASKTGFPAAERVLKDLRPFIGQLDPALRQLNPILAYLGLYKRELPPFFANSVAATQASTVSARAGRVHYLRTTNPFNLENLAVYPHRIGSNRTNAYSKPGHFDKLREGLLSYETRHCSRGVPTITNTPSPVPPAPQLPQLNLPTPIPDAVQGVTDSVFSYPESLVNDIIKYAAPVGNGSGAAPRCVNQGPYTVQGETSQFPHLKPD